MRNVLVVEDSPMILKVLSHLFCQENDFEPVFCASLQEAEVLLESAAGTGLIFAALLDLILPDAPNGEIVDYVMSHNIPCIVLTSTYNERRRDELIAKGVVDYIVKESAYSYEYALRLLRRLTVNTQTKILVAEDSTATRHHICNMLRPHCFQILEAEDGSAALEILQKQPDIDLLLVDYGMPGLNGLELVKLLRHTMRRTKLAIIGLSAHHKGDLSAMFIKHGADDFLRKPFCAEELSCRVMLTLERRDLIKALKQAAEFDALTGLYNRRAFYESGTALCQKAKQNNASFTLAMMDLDFFKAINDNYGHAAGDVALVQFSRLLAKTFPEALTGRLGGEEFAIVTIMGCTELAEILGHMRIACAALVYAPEAPALSFSAGVCSSNGVYDFDALLQKADKHLYEAKRQGRARTCC